MSRIRTIKPEFFRHEGLQALESDHPGKYVMLVYAGLWTVADKAGRFEWRAKHLKLDILPFLDFDFEQTLTILAEAQFIKAYEVDGKRYGLIPALPDHQRFGGSEAKNPPKYPEPGAFLVIEPPKGALGKHLGSTEETCSASQGNTNLKAETPRKHLGSQERNKERNKGKEFSDFPNAENLIPSGDSAVAAPAPSAPESEQPLTFEWPNSWAFDTCQRFLTHSVVMPTATCGAHAKLVKGTMTWDEWLRVVDRMAASGDAGYGLPALLRRLPTFRDDAQLDPNRPLTLEEALA